MEAASASMCDGIGSVPLPASTGNHVYFYDDDFQKREISSSNTLSNTNAASITASEGRIAMNNTTSTLSNTLSNTASNTRTTPPRKIATDDDKSNMSSNKISNTNTSLNIALKTASSGRIATDDTKCNINIDSPQKADERGSSDRYTSDHSFIDNQHPKDAFKQANLFSDAQTNVTKQNKKSRATTITKESQESHGRRRRTESSQLIIKDKTGIYVYYIYVCHYIILYILYVKHIIHVIYYVISYLLYMLYIIFMIYP